MSGLGWQALKYPNRENFNRIFKQTMLRLVTGIFEETLFSGVERFAI